MVAIVALGWTMYAYFYPRPAADAAAPPSTSAPAGATESAPASQPVTPSAAATATRKVTNWATGIAERAGGAASRLHARYERDRYDRSWWALLLIWCAMAGLALWMLWQEMPFLLVPLLEYAYVDYYGPSLSAWGTTVSIVGGVVVTLIALVVRLDQRI